MKNVFKNLLVGSLLLFGAGACADLEITNFNDPDASRTLATGSDVVSLISGAYNTIFRVHNSYSGAGMATNNAAFTYCSPWANCGQEKYGRLPRISFINDLADNEYAYMHYTWFRSYRAIAGAADGLRSLENEDIQAELTADELARAKAFGKFVLGYGHATIAAVYDRGFVVDETTDLAAAQEPMGYNDLMDVAMGYFYEDISLSTGGWSIPESWMQLELSTSEFVRVIHSFKARFRIAAARTPAERQAISWSAVIADVDAGVTEDFVPYYDDYGGWSMDVLGIGTDYGWGQMCYWIWGMADQAGDYQAWLALANSDKYNYLPNGDPVLIVTPDTRFPQGTTIEEQRAHQGSYFRIVTDDTAGETWKRADRGTWRWSYYDNYNGEQYWYGTEADYWQPEFKLSEMRLIKAEGLMNTGNPGGAAAIINETRTAAGLNATDASGTNTSCVPKLPNGTCGNLMEMLKWEKRTENTLKGILSAGQYFDSRGWGDLYQGTFTSLPIPCGEIQTLQMLPCETNFGGPGGVYAAERSSYQYPHEGG
jgi:hypothetical protein